MNALIAGQLSRMQEHSGSKLPSLSRASSAGSSRGQITTGVAIPTANPVGFRGLVDPQATVNLVARPDPKRVGPP